MATSGLGMGVTTLPTPRREGLILEVDASMEKAVKTSSLASASESRGRCAAGGADDGAGAGTEAVTVPGVAAIDRGTGEAGGPAVVGVGVVGVLPAVAACTTRVGDAGGGAGAGEAPNNPKSLSVAGALVNGCGGVAGGGGATVGEDTSVNDPLVWTFFVLGVVSAASWSPLAMTLPGDTVGFNDSPANKSDDILVCPSNLSW